MKSYNSPYVEIIDIIPQTILNCSGTDVCYMNGKAYYYSADSKKYYCPIKENFKCPVAKDDFPTTDYCIIKGCDVYFSKEVECGEDFLKKQQFFYCPIKGDAKCLLAKKKFPSMRLCYKEPCEIHAEWSKEQYLIRKYGIRNINNIKSCPGTDICYMNGKEYHYSADSKKYYCPIKENFKCPIAKDYFPITDYCIIEGCDVYFSKEVECGEGFLKKQQFFYCPIKGDVKCPLAKKKFPSMRLCFKEPCEIYAEWSKKR